jgi:hypothetical protein
VTNDAPYQYIGCNRLPSFLSYLIVDRVDPAHDPVRDASVLAFNPRRSGVCDAADPYASH